MSLPSSPPHTTRLENLSFDPDGVKFDLDGRSVRLARETAGPAFAALQVLYRSALADYQARPLPSAKPGWFTRLRTWLGRLIGGSGAQARERAWWDARSATPPGPASHPGPEGGGLADDGNRPRLHRSPASPLVPQAAASPVAEAPGGELPFTAGQKERRPGEARVPALRAVFADPGGVRLVWQAPGARSEGENVERIHPLDSQLARHLGDCYDHLGRLGYKIVGLDLLRTVAPEPAADAAAESAAKPAAKGPHSPSAKPEKAAFSPHADAPKSVAAEPAKPATASSEPAGKKDAASLVARLLPDDCDQPTRALVRPIGEAETTQVLVAPEKMLRALRAAADPGRPVEERLTFLRCGPGKAGLKVLEVGLGDGKEPGPARWEELAPWLARQQAEAGLASKKPHPAPPPPRPTAEPELDL